MSSFSCGVERFFFELLFVFLGIWGLVVWGVGGLMVMVGIFLVGVVCCCVIVMFLFFEIFIGVGVEFEIGVGVVLVIVLRVEGCCGIFVGCVGIEIFKFIGVIELVFCFLFIGFGVGDSLFVRGGVFCIVVCLII